MSTSKNGKPTEIQSIPREIEMLERAATYLAECQDLDEVKDLRDKAEALRLYQKKRGDSDRAGIAAAAIKVRAERRIGQLIRPSGVQQGGDKTKSPVATLDGLGLTKSDSSRCQAMAALPAEEFEATVNQAIAAERQPTSRELYTKSQNRRRAEAEAKKSKEQAEKERIERGARTWKSMMQSHFQIVNSIRKMGGAEILVKGWKHGDKEEFVGCFDQLIEELEDLRSQLRRLIDAGS